MARTNYDLGVEVEALLEDYCAANDGTPKVRVIRKAIKHYIEYRRQNPEIEKRMDEARKDRLAPQREKITVIGSTINETEGGGAT